MMKCVLLMWPKMREMKMVVAFRIVQGSPIYTLLAHEMAERGFVKPESCSFVISLLKSPCNVRLCEFSGYTTRSVKLF